MHKRIRMHYCLWTEFLVGVILVCSERSKYEEMNIHFWRAVKQLTNRIGNKYRS